mgnify:CR=1 FL=1
MKLLLHLCLVLLSPMMVKANAPAKPLNVIFMLVDDLGWTDLGCYGGDYFETPNIDRLARQGMKFTQAYSACTVCSPTRASLLTGKYPATLKVTDWITGHVRPFAQLRVPDWTQHLPTNEVTLAQRLKSAGYATASIGKWHLGGEAHRPEVFGFDVNIGGFDKGSPPNYFSPYKNPHLTDGPQGEYLTDRLTQEAVNYIERNKERPFFIYLPHYAVHTPIQAKPEVADKYRNKPLPSGKEINPAYAALVESVDDSVGALMKKLDETGIADRTVFFFTSDNGGLIKQTVNVPLRAGKGSAYEGGIRVPLIVRWPGMVKPGSVCDTPVITPDYYPTILEMTGVADAAGHAVEGASLMPLLRETGGLKRTAIYWHYPHYHPGGATPHSAIRDGDFKLLEFFEDGRFELYNLREDIGETVNLAAADPDKAMALHGKLDLWRRETGAQSPMPNPDYDPKRENVPLRR